MPDRHDTPQQLLERIAQLEIELSNADGHAMHWRMKYEALLQSESGQGVKCRHGWRGSPIDNAIVTPCPACGAKSLFIGEGGHLTCARVPNDFSNGCDSPSVEATVNALKSDLAKAVANHSTDLTPSATAPTQIIDPPGAAVETFRRREGRLPTRAGDHLPLSDRLELAAQACHAAHLLSCEQTCRDAINALDSRSHSDE